MAKWKLEWSRMFGKQMRFQETFGCYSKQERVSDSQLRIYLLTCIAILGQDTLLRIQNTG